ncbi:MAG: acyl carrier protein [Saprospiraceae bacterium]|nr:acyl carrier protein [Saprospiraceae bacterium]
MQKLIEMFCEILELEKEDILESDCFRDYQDWDSLAFLALQALINEEYDITIPRADFERVQTIEELFQLIQSKRK